MNKIIRVIVIAILGLALFYLGGEAGYQVKYRLEQWKNYRAMERFNQSIIDMLKGDTYGGETPEATFNMFVEALKNEDVDLAVKYFVMDPDRRATYWKEFNDIKNEGKLREYGEWFPRWEDWNQIANDENDAKIEYKWHLDKEEIVMWPDGSGGYVETTLPIGDYMRSIIFTKNINNIWKIESL
ncbi:MAG: hypothetical protein WC845_01720 [Candidatus Staskawiczbacteria bacterium]|jgi:hypothetical protein